MNTYPEYETRAIEGGRTVGVRSLSRREGGISTMKTRWIVPIVGLAVLALAGPARAQVKYVDDKGVVHWVQNESMVPAKYRSKTDLDPKLPTINKDTLMNRAELESRLEGANERLKILKEGNIPNVGDSASRELVQRVPALQPDDRPVKPIRMCVAGVRKEMHGAGQWRDAGQCERRDPGEWNVPGTLR